MNSKFFLYSILSCLLLAGLCKTSSMDKKQAQVDPCDCGEVPLQIVPRIIGGESAGTGEIPWRVALMTIQNGNASKEGFLCGGSIIHRNWILAAAHCFDSIKTGPESNGVVQITYGSNTRSDRESTVAIRGTNVKVHPQWNPDTHMNDIALIHYSPGFDMSNPRIAKCCLPYKFENTTLKNKTVLASGWGEIENRDVPKEMRKATLNMFEYQECNQKLEESFMTNRIGPTQICTRTPGKDICTGDSGGTVDYNDLERMYCLGVNSFVMGHCANPRGVSVMTKVSMYLNWIESETRQSYCKE